MADLRETEAEDTLDETLRKTRIEELESDDGDSDYEDVPDFATGVPFPGKPTLQKAAWQKALPPWLQPETFNLFHDDLETETSEKQKSTTEECLALLRDPSTLGLPLNSHGIPHLNREKHVKFLEGWLGPFPEPYVAMDASRPWIFYWTMAGLSFLGEDVSQYKERLMETVKPLQQHPDGGFGGGHGQLAHCAGTYATLLALAAVDGLEVVNRKTMWNFLGQVKQPSGGFRMAIGGEEDVRGAYCALTALTLLNLPLTLPPDSPARRAGLTTFLDGLGPWISRCQYYEGGIGGAPDGEAHGAYAFCALACLALLDAPHLSIPKYLNTTTLTIWLSHTQTTPEGGFAGRTNKLVDACYSHWIGGCWSLLQASLSLPSTKPLWNRPALIRYLLTCSQPAGKKGGMRDKPSVRADAYHTCYSLSGLSAAMNTYTYDVEKKTRDEKTGRLEAAFNWKAEGPREEEWEALLVDIEDLVVPVHPVFVLRMEAVERARERFAEGGL